MAEYCAALFYIDLIKPIKKNEVNYDILEKDNKILQERD